MTRFVLDASYAISWVVEAERTPECFRLYEALKKEQAQALVPALWADEVANVLMTLERTGRLTTAQIQTWCESFGSLPIDVKLPSISESLNEIRLLGQSKGLTAYDARYPILLCRRAWRWQRGTSNWRQPRPRLASNLWRSGHSSILGI